MPSASWSTPSKSTPPLSVTLILLVCTRSTRTHLRLPPISMGRVLRKEDCSSAKFRSVPVFLNVTYTDVSSSTSGSTIMPYSMGEDQLKPGTLLRCGSTADGGPTMSATSRPRLARTRRMPARAVTGSGKAPSSSSSSPSPPVAGASLSAPTPAARKVSLRMRCFMASTGFSTPDGMSMGTQRRWPPPWPRLRTSVALSVLSLKGAQTIHSTRHDPGKVPSTPAFVQVFTNSSKALPVSRSRVLSSFLAPGGALGDDMASMASAIFGDARLMASTTADGTPMAFMSSSSSPVPYAAAVCRSRIAPKPIVGRPREITIARPPSTARALAAVCTAARLGPAPTPSFCSAAASASSRSAVMVSVMPPSSRARAQVPAGTGAKGSSASGTVMSITLDTALPGVGTTTCTPASSKKPRPKRTG
mmetsp:Transcript_27773/g.88141  ORF Transcript_27773/g.88141 Transcript_27773/m.88141 type:complete len:418 (+) Transcript_27773:958-2211(+)